MEFLGDKKATIFHEPCFCEEFLDYTTINCLKLLAESLLNNLVYLLSVEKFGLDRKIFRNFLSTKKNFTENVFTLEQNTKLKNHFLVECSSRLTVQRVDYPGSKKQNNWQAELEIV